MEKEKDLRMLFSPRFISSLLNFCNPFGLGEMTGDSLLFKDVTEAYFFVMVRVMTLFPRGYVDMILLLCHLYPQCSSLQIEEMKRNAVHVGLSDDVVLIKVWSSNKSEDFFRKLFAGLHAVCQTKYNGSAFLKAMDEFRVKLESLKMCNEHKREDDELE